MCECSRCWDNLEVNKRWAFHNTVPLRSCRMKQCKSASVRGLLCLNSQCQRNVFCYQNQRRNDRPLLDQAADDTQRIVDGALCLLDHQLVGAPNHDAHRLPGGAAACDLQGATAKRLLEASHHSVTDSTSHPGDVFLFRITVFCNCLVFVMMCNWSENFYQLWIIQDLSTKTDPDTYLDQLARAVQVDLLSQLCCAEHLWSEVVDVSDGLGANSLEGRGDFVLLYRHTVGFIRKEILIYGWDLDRILFLYVGFRHCLLRTFNKLHQNSRDADNKKGKVIKTQMLSQGYKCPPV